MSHVVSYSRVVLQSPSGLSFQPFTAQVNDASFVVSLSQTFSTLQRFIGPVASVSIGAKLKNLS